MKNLESMRSFFFHKGMIRKNPIPGRDVWVLINEESIELLNNGNNRE